MYVVVHSVRQPVLLCTAQIHTNETSPGCAWTGWETCWNIQLQVGGGHYEGEDQLMVVSGQYVCIKLPNLVCLSNAGSSHWPCSSYVSLIPRPYGSRKSALLHAAWEWGYSCGKRVEGRKGCSMCVCTLMDYCTLGVLKKAISFSFLPSSFLPPSLSALPPYLLPSSPLPPPYLSLMSPLPPHLPSLFSPHLPLPPSSPLLPLPPHPPRLPSLPLSPLPPLPLPPSLPLLSSDPDQPEWSRWGESDTAMPDDPPQHPGRSLPAELSCIETHDVTINQLPKQQVSTCRIPFSLLMWLGFHTVMLQMSCAYFTFVNFASACSISNKRLW